MKKKRRLGDFDWVEICKELLQNSAYYLDYGTFPVCFWDYVTALRGCDLVCYNDIDSIQLRQAVGIRGICKKYITALLRGKRIGRDHFVCWFEEITQKEIKGLKEIITSLTKLSLLVFEYFEHYFFHARAGFLALGKVLKDERYRKLGKALICLETQTNKDALLNYLKTLVEMMEEELKGGGK